MRNILSLAVILLAFLPSNDFAAVKVVTSTPDLADLTKAVGGDKVKVSYIVRGTQNPHYIEVKPSYMLKLRSADMFVIVGLQMEIWYKQIVDGSRNANLLIVDCSKHIEKLEVPTYKLDASYGDVHPYGNPHYWLDPENVKIILAEIVDGLSSISPADHDFFTTNMNNYLQKLDAKIAEWQKITAPFKGRKFVSYHTSFSYFVKRFGFVVAGNVEPKPGIPPTPSHTTELIHMIRNGKIGVIGLEPFYDDSIPQRIAETTGAKLITLPTSVGGVPEAKDYFSLMDCLVHRLTEAFSAG